ncbi:MAG: inorganic phosphate transporter [Chloroflexi bacterium]|nr:MAG: inorganic phosphate transporter [Chloroflexota bacterium]
MTNPLSGDSLLILFVATALLFDFLNGFHDSANTVATMIASRAMSPRKALLLSAVAHFSGPFLFGVAVATTIGHEVVADYATTIPVVWAALLGAIIWNLLTWLLGIPSSSSHALIGGLIGATLIGYGTDAIQIAGLEKAGLALLTSPLLGLAIGYLLMKIILFLARNASPSINTFFKRIQIITALMLALSHGTNDAQKTMGIITMGLLAGGAISTFEVPTWVIAACAASMSLGTALGGWRIIRTLGGKFYKIRPVHSFTSQLASAGIIMGAALIGGPVSTSQVVSTTILGAGAAERVNKVRWGVMKSILATWFLTIPASAGMAALCYLLLQGRI